LKAVVTFYQFSRPHTVWGTIFSISVLYLLACTNLQSVKTFNQVWLYTLLASLCCNIFITGLNQLVDVDLDKINKPDLPLAAGNLKIAHAQLIVVTCFILSLVIGFIVSPALGFLILTINCIGIAYSQPPIQLKQHHVTAAICISLVRGFMVNIGMYLHFKLMLQPSSASTVPTYIWLLTAFIIAFSIAIAWFKDLSDVTGDKIFKYKTFPVLYSTRFAFTTGNVLIVLAYLGTIVFALWQKQYVLLVLHIILLIAYLWHAYGTNTQSKSALKKFYTFFWVFFFAEYTVFALWHITILAKN
jgi:homogentisate phytyltransferase / homogentisate geranylgeranyltransferase